METTRYIDRIGQIKVKSIDHHRNGICGEPFDVVTFTQKNGHKNQNMVAILFENSGNCAVFDTDLLGQGNIIFGENSWRGDNYEQEMRKVVQEYWDEKCHPVKESLEDLCNNITENNKQELVDWGNDVGNELFDD